MAMEDRYGNGDGSTTESEYYEDSDSVAALIPTQDALPPCTHSIRSDPSCAAPVEATQIADDLDDPPRWNNVVVVGTLDAASHQAPTADNAIHSEADHDVGPSHVSPVFTPAIETVPVSETVATSETTETESCPVCFAEVAPTESYENLSPRHAYSFCACCRRAQPDRKFAKSERQRGALKRCRDCAERTRDTQSPAMLPDRNTDQRVSRRATVTNIKQRYEWRRLAEAPLVVDPRVLALNEAVDVWKERKLVYISTVRLALQHGDATIAYSRALYEELLVLDDQELVLTEREVALYTELLAALPREDDSGANQGTIVRGGYIHHLSIVRTCEGCHATIPSPPIPVDDEADVKAVLCTCCCLVLPSISFDETQSDANCSFPRCLKCVAMEPRADTKRLHANWPHAKKMSSMFSIQWMFRREVKAAGKRVTQPFDAFLEAEADNLPARSELKQQQQRLKDLNIQNRNLVNGIDVEFQGDRLRLSRALYEEFVQVQGAIVTVLPELLEQLDRLFRTKGIRSPQGWRKALKSANWYGNNQTNERPLAKKQRV